MKAGDANLLRVQCEVVAERGETIEMHPGTVIGLLDELEAIDKSEKSVCSALDLAAGEIAELRVLCATRDAACNDLSAMLLSANAACDELRLCSANERGEGEAPSEGWRWTSLMWLGKDLMGWANDSLQICVCQTGYQRVWVWQTFDGSDSDRGDDRWTARAAMREAVAARGAR